MLISINVAILFFINLFIPINLLEIRISNSSIITVNGFKAKKQFHESKTDLIEYNWEWGMTRVFVSACLFSLIFFLIALGLKKSKVSEQGKEYKAAIIGFILGATGVCNVLRAAKTLSIETGFIQLDISQSIIAAKYIVGGTFFGLLCTISLVTAFKKIKCLGKGDVYFTIPIFKCTIDFKIKAMAICFWGPSYGQLVGTIMFDASTKGFTNDTALMTLCGCLIFTFIGCTILYNFKPRHNLKIYNHSFEEDFRTYENYDIWLNDSIKIAGIYYIIFDVGLFG